MKLFVPMEHKAKLMGRLIRLELTRVVLLV